MLRFGRPPNEGEIVQVYRNLTRKVWSVRVKGRVIAHLENLWLCSCRYEVSEAGRERVLRTGRKFVHAWISGAFLPTAPKIEGAISYVTGYDPKKASGFMVAGCRVPGHQTAAFVAFSTREGKSEVLSYFNPHPHFLSPEGRVHSQVSNFQTQV